MTTLMLPEVAELIGDVHTGGMPADAAEPEEPLVLPHSAELHIVDELETSTLHLGRHVGFITFSKGSARFEATCLRGAHAWHRPLPMFPTFDRKSEDRQSI